MHTLLKAFIEENKDTIIAEPSGRTYAELEENAIKYRYMLIKGLE